MKANFWSSAAANGLMLSLITVVYTLFMAAFPMESRVAGFLVGLVKLIATIGVLYYFMKGFGQEQESYTYGNAFGYGFAVSFFSNIVIACYLLVHYVYLFPDAIENSLKAVQQAMTQYTVDQATLDLINKNLPLIVSISPFLVYTLLALIIAAILAGFAKKAEPIFTEDTQE